MLDANFVALASMRHAPPEAAWRLLDSIGRRANGAVAWALRERVLDTIPTDDWPTREATLRRIFCLDQDEHCFRAKSHDWLSLTETQVTGGFRHFLSNGAVAERHRRVAALFAACHAPLQAGDVIATAVFADQPLKSGKRPDIVALARMADGVDRLLVIEGKLGHRLSADQLKSYEKGLPQIIDDHDLRCGPDAANLVVIGTRRRSDDDKILHRYTRWRFITWRDLLIRLDRLVATADDDNFRRFRRTLWERSA